jgi:EpsI family protein
LNSLFRLSSVLLALLVPLAALGYVLVGTPERDLSFDAQSIAPEVGRLQLAGSRRLSPEVFAMVEPADYAFRLYRESPADPGIWSYVAFYRGVDRSNAHDPDVCYPAQGWEIIGRRETRLRMPDRGELHATLLRAHLDGREERVLYWFQPTGRWPRGALAEDLLRVYDRLRGAPEYAFVRLSTRDATGEAPMERLRSFARVLAPLVRAELESRARQAPPLFD